MKRDAGAVGMPWSFRIALGFYALAGVGACVVARAFFMSGWDAISVLAWGMLIALPALVMGWICALVCAVTRPAWRRPAAVACVLSGVIFLVTVVVMRR